MTAPVPVPVPAIVSRARRSVVVTGAASGIGRAAAPTFAALGDRGLAAGLDAEGVEETVRRVTASGASPWRPSGTWPSSGWWAPWWPARWRSSLPRMLATGAGCLVLTGSEAGLRGSAAGPRTPPPSTGPPGW